MGRGAFVVGLDSGGGEASPRLAGDSGRAARLSARYASAIDHYLGSLGIRHVQHRLVRARCHGKGRLRQRMPADGKTRWPFFSPS